MKLKGFVAVILWSLCIQGFAAAESNPVGGGLEISFSTSRGWGGLPVFCNPVKASDGAPSNAGVRFMIEGVAPETGKFLDGKCYLIVKDAEGEILLFVVAGQIYPDLLTGPVTRELKSIAGTSIDMLTNSVDSEASTPGRKPISELLGGKSGNGAIDGPVSLAGVAVVMRGTCENVRLKILEIQFDGKTVETFKDNHNGWYVPDWKEHKEDYDKFGPGFNVTVAGENLTPSSSVSSSPAVIDYSKASAPAPADYSRPSGAKLEVTVFQPRTWSSLVIGPREPVQFQEVPKMFGFYTNGDASSSVKTYVILRDSKGVDYEVFISNVLYAGYTEVVVLGAAGKPGEDEKRVFFTDAKPPFTFYGFDFYCRKPLPETMIYFDNITVDGKLIEGFDKDNKWEVKLKPEDSECIVRLSKESERTVVADIFPERQENLIVNSSMEEDIGGWEYGKEEYVPKDVNGNLIVNMNEHGGKYKWEDEGVESFHSMSMEADTPGKWAGIFTVVKDVKPNTSYVLTFAHRMSQPSGFSLSVFGKSVDVLETFRENPEHWVKFTRAFKSGSYHGDVPIGFYVRAQDMPIKIGIDEVEMYEGFSPIGYDLARLHLYYYNHAYVSPDMALPVRFQMETLFSNEKTPDEFSYIFELPEEVRWEGFWCRWSFFSGLESAMSVGKLSKEPIDVDGKRYIRYSFTLPLQKGSQYQKQFVTASARADMHGYSGCKTFTAFLGTNEKEGEFSGYYYARWSGGEQAKRKFLIKPVSVDKVSPFKRFEANLSVDRGDVKYGPQFSEQMLSLGIEGFTVHQRDADIIKICQDAGIKRFSQFMNMPCFDVKEDSGAGSGDDKPSRNCLSYRGNYWKRGVTALMSDIGYGFTDFILDDAPEVTCYCKECTDAFKVFLSLHTKLSYKSPRSFGSGDEEYAALWKEFSLWHYGTTAKSLRDELRAYAGEKYPGRNIRLASSSLPTALSSIRHPFSAEGIKEGLDYYTGQWYINWAYGHQGSPILMGDRISVEYKAMGEYAPPLMPNLGPGLDFTNPFNSLDPHEVMKYQMLEMAFAIPMAGYHIYSAEDVDGGDIKYLAEFNKIVSMYEDVIIDGKPVPGISCAGLRSSARLKELNGKYLLLVSNYSTYGETPTVVTVTLPFAPKAKLKDVETGEVVTTLKGDVRTFDVTLGKNRARLFSFDPI